MGSIRCPSCGEDVPSSDLPWCKQCNCNVTRVRIRDTERFRHYLSERGYLGKKLVDSGTTFISLLGGGGGDSSLNNRLAYFIKVRDVIIGELEFSKASACVKSWLSPGDKADYSEHWEEIRRVFSDYVTSIEPGQGRSGDQHSG